MSSTRLRNLTLIDHWFDVPLDYAKPAQTIRIYAREVVATDRLSANQPRLVFLQGGPGFGAPRPMDDGGWLGRALKDFRVVLLDQRGTGRSTPISAEMLSTLPSAVAQAEYLSHFRADNIVRDCETIRTALQGDEPWTVLGQSYGGFCAMRYLSAAPQGLAKVLITGGIPSLTRTADEVYAATYPRVAAKNHAYFARYPNDRALVDRIAALLRERVNDPVVMPRGGALSVERFLQLGLAFGMSDGYESVHYLLEEAFVAGPKAGELSQSFLRGIEAALPYGAHPVFAILHEPIYAQGAAPHWSAERLRASFAEFSPLNSSPLFTGEMVYPAMFVDDPLLVPLKPAADLLAAKADWPALYDVAALSQNRVPVRAAVYYDDMYVHREYSEETAALVPNTQLWITNEYEHNGLRADGVRIVDRLLTK